jgi:hypothetical protein
LGVFHREIQVAQGAKADPLLVTVVMAKNGIMKPIVAENGIQTIVGNDLFLIDQQGGCYDEGAWRRMESWNCPWLKMACRQLLERVSFVSISRVGFTTKAIASF